MKMCDLYRKIPSNPRANDGIAEENSAGTETTPGTAPDVDPPTAGTSGPSHSPTSASASALNSTSVSRGVDAWPALASPIHTPAQVRASIGHRHV
jgi:hypothetical protein